VVYILYINISIYHSTVYFAKSVNDDKKSGIICATNFLSLLHRLYSKMGARSIYEYL
jgi:hypothetical protein